MDNKQQLIEGDLKKLYFRFLVPSILAMCAYSAYIIDAAFIGNGIGREAFASYNLVLPIFMFFTAISTLLGIGGATVAAVSIGRGEYENVNKVFTYSVGCAVVLGTVTFLCSIFFLDPIARFVGANDSNIGYVREYMRFILMFGAFSIGGFMLTHFARNDNAPKAAMYFVVMSAIVNIILDYTFIYIFEWGMTGAGLSTAISLVSAAFVCLFPHFGKGNTKLRFDLKCGIDAKLIRRMIANGISPAIIEVSTSITLFVFNMVLLRVEGTNAVAAYGVMTNVILICVSIFNGIAQAMQPITSVNYGAGKRDRVTGILRLGLISAVVADIALILFMNIFPNFLVSVFVSEPGELEGFAELAVPGIRIASAGVLAMGFNLVIGGFFQSVEVNRISMIITMCRGFLLVVPCMLALTYLFGIMGCWASLPIAEFLTFAFTIFAFRFVYKNGKVWDKFSKTEKTESEKSRI